VGDLVQRVHKAFDHSGLAAEAVTDQMPSEDLLEVVRVEVHALGLALRDALAEIAVEIESSPPRSRRVATL
jgi:hypothetical protein